MALSDNVQFEVINRKAEFYKPFQNDEVLAIERNIKDSVSKIIARTTIEDPSFEFKDVILSGSIAEGLQVRHYDFDFLLVLKTKFELKEDDTLKPGFVNIILEQKLDPFRLRRRFYRALMKALQSLHLTDNVLVTLKKKAVSVKLQIVDDTLACSHTDVDLVLALQPPLSFWPRCSKKWKLERSLHKGLPAEVIEEIVANGVYFVPRYEFVSGKQEQSHWRVSFSAAESVIIRKMTLAQRSAFRMMKVILERQTKKSIQDKETDEWTKSFVDKMTTTYHIKTILLHLNEDASLSKLEERQYLICILKALLHSLKTMHLTHYFIPDINLYSELKENPAFRNFPELAEMYKFSIQQYEELLENLPEDLSELKNEAEPGRIVILIPPHEEAYVMNDENPYIIS